MKIKQIIKTAGAVGFALMLGLAPALSAEAYGDSAYGWSLDGESTVPNKVEKADGTEIVPTTQVNFHVGCVSGVVVTTPFLEMTKMMDISDDEIYYGSRPVLYVGMARDGEIANKLIDDSIAGFSGTRIENMDIQLFEWTGSNFQAYTTTTSPLNLVVGIAKKDRISDKSYALLHLSSDGKVTYYYDTDSDSATVTFTTSDFTGTYVLFSYPKDREPAADTTAPAAPADTTGSNTQNSEYDDVPKTGETGNPLSLLLFAGGMLLLAGGFALKRRAAQ